jgi:FMN phosphatase YigB (HAD superfamily)
MIRAVISDLGRVVLWFDNGIFLRKLADRAGKPFGEVKALVHGDLELIRRFDGGVVTPAGFHERVTALVGADIAYGDFYEIYNDIFTPIPPVIDLLARVKAAGYKTLLLSNTDPERFGFVRRRFEILFGSYVLSYELGCRPNRYLPRRRAGQSRPSTSSSTWKRTSGRRRCRLAGVVTPETDLEAGSSGISL